MLRDPLGFDLLVLDQDVYNGLEGSIGGYHDPTLATEVALDDGASLPGVIVHPASRWLDASPTASRDLSPVDRAVAIMAELRVTRSELGAELRRSAVLAAPARHDTRIRRCSPPSPVTPPRHPARRWCASPTSPRRPTS